jgi:hypothetical protein
MVILKSVCARVCVCDMGKRGRACENSHLGTTPKLFPEWDPFSNNQRVEFVMTSWATLIFWRKIVQIDIYYYFQRFFNEHEGNKIQKQSYSGAYIIPQNIYVSNSS